MNIITKYALNYLIMNISETIEQLQKEHDELAAHKKDIHKRMVGIRTRIGKLKTVLKKAEEVLKPETSAETLKQVTENLK